MLHLIAPECFGEFKDELAAMHRLRRRVFDERLGWDVEVIGDREIDSFDSYHPTYLVQCDRVGRVSGCVRMMCTTGPTMLRDVFPQLLHGTEMPDCPLVWESSRFAVDPDGMSVIGPGGLSIATYELMAGMVEFGLSQGLKEIVTVTDVRLERISRRAQWPLRRIGPPVKIGDTMAVAGFLDVSRPALARLREGGDIQKPVLWAPVISPIAA